LSIIVDGVSKAYGGRPVLVQLELRLGDREVVSVLGPSGSGKTTLLRLIAGLAMPDTGRLLIDGEVVSRPGWCLAPHRRGIGFAFQDSALWPHMTVAQNIAFGLGRAGRDEVQGRVEELLGLLELDGLSRRYPDELSGGQARRVNVARALAPRPEILLLDEPLTNVEPVLRSRLLEVVRAQAEADGSCVVHVTHDEADARIVGGRVLRLSDGRLI
jgi:iron(III) transport system ATP-binding protein